MDRLIARADKLATENGKTLSTGYLLLSMIEARDTTSNLLKMQGLTETRIRAGLRHLDEEPGQLLETAVAKAFQVAETFYAAAPAPAHLLVAVSGLEESHAALIFKKYRQKIKFSISDILDDKNNVAGARVSFAVPYSTI